MNKQQAIQIRMLNQQLLFPLYEEPEEIVAWQGAMQAQDYNYFRWAIGIRQRMPCCFLFRMVKKIPMPLIYRQKSM